MESGAAYAFFAAAELSVVVTVACLVQLYAARVCVDVKLRWDVAHLSPSHWSNALPPPSGSIAAKSIFMLPPVGGAAGLSCGADLSTVVVFFRPFAFFACSSARSAFESMVCASCE